MRLTVLFLRRKTILCLSYKKLRGAMLLLHDYVKNYDSEIFANECEHFLKILFLKKCFDISEIIFNYNQTIDKISHWNLRPITINITTKHYYKNITNWFSCKKTLCSNSFLGLLFVYWTLMYNEKNKHYFLVTPSDLFMNPFLSKSKWFL